MHDAALEWIASTLVDAVEQGRRSPAAVTVLLRLYADTGREAYRSATERALTDILPQVASIRDARERLEWLGTLADASAISDDDQLPQLVQQLLPATIDDLETFVRASYEPGEGLLGASLADHVRTASALLTAFELTGRLPYSMLAEELLIAARRQGWDAERRVFADDFSANCVAAQLACRLAVLHRDPDYAAAAVVAPDADYERDARIALDALDAVYRDHPDAAAAYGLALINWFTLNPHPN